jgi:Tat protein secretion system quality control protein TatD with DNase activity
MLPPFIDIHTHVQAANDVASLLVRNCHSDFGLVPAGQYCSMGLHPWYLQNADADFKLLAQSAL